MRSRFWGPAGEEKPHSQAEKGPQGPGLHPPTTSLLSTPTPPPPPATSPPLPKGRRKSLARLIFHQRQLKNGCLSQHRSLPSPLCSPPRAAEGSPKGGARMSEGGCKRRGIVQSSRSGPAATPNFLSWAAGSGVAVGWRRGAAGRRREPGWFTCSQLRSI